MSTCDCGRGWTANDTITISISFVALAISELLGLFKNSKYHSIIHILLDFVSGALGATVGTATAPLAIAAAAGAEAVHHAQSAQKWVSQICAHFIRKLKE
jgi:hypothetical protein